MAKLAKLDDIVSLCKRRGFIFQSSEIYGGLASCYDYGPLGVELKRNVREACGKASSGCATTWSDLTAVF